MLPSRLVPSGQQSAMRKSRLEHQRPSMLPKPRRPGSTDRLSNEARRPSAAGHRSSSAEPARGTFGGARLSREASATKISLSGVRSRSQQGDRFGQTYMTPLRNSQYSRPTTTPVRTPSEDRASRSWQTALERVLAFVTAKDQRPISSVVWQRAEVSRVGSALSARGEGGGMALLRPLTIARFVDIVAALLVAFTRDANKINTDNYVTKLPHLAKKLLYPGTLSKSWLKTVNTLHAFPQALALIGYLLDLVNHIEKEVSDDWLYVGKDELACYRRDYLYKCWIRFQDPDPQFEDLNEEHLQNVRALLGDDEEKIAELMQVIKKYKSCLNDEEYISGRADEARRMDRREALLASLRAERQLIHAARVECDEQRTTQRDQIEAIKHLDLEIERATAENQQLKLELESQPLSVEQRTKLLDEADYALRVQDSKRALAEQIAKMVMSRETELAVWQKKTLDSCMHYNQGLIHLSAQFPDLTALAIDEKDLMSAECSMVVSRALDTLRARGAALTAQRSEHAREKSALARKRAAMLEETRTKIAELKSSVHREQESLDTECSKESLEAATVTAELRAVGERLQELKVQLEEYAKLDSELHFWEQQDQLWRSKLLALQEYINEKRVETQRLLEAARLKRAQDVINCVKGWNEKLAA